LELDIHIDIDSTCKQAASRQAQGTKPYTQLGA